MKLGKQMKKKVRQGRRRESIKEILTKSLVGGKLLAISRRLKVGRTYGSDSQQTWTQNQMQLEEKTQDSTSFSKDNVKIESLTNIIKVRGATTKKIEKKPHSGIKVLRRIGVRTTKGAGQEVSEITIAISLLNLVGQGLTMI